MDSHRPFFCSEGRKGRNGIEGEGRKQREGKGSKGKERQEKGEGGEDNWKRGDELVEGIAVCGIVISLYRRGIW